MTEKQEEMVLDNSNEGKQNENETIQKEQTSGNLDNKEEKPHLKVQPLEDEEKNEEKIEEPKVEEKVQKNEENEEKIEKKEEETKSEETSLKNDEIETQKEEKIEVEKIEEEKPKVEDEKLKNLSKFEKIKHQVIENMSFKNQKELKELTVYDLFMWKNIYVSLLVLVSLHAYYMLVTSYKYTLVTLVGRIVFFQVLFFIVFNLVTQKFFPQFKKPDFDLRISEELVNRLVKELLNSLNCSLGYYTDILKCKDVVQSGLFVLKVHVFCWVCNLMSSLTLFYIFVVYQFVFPKLFIVYDKEIEKMVSAVKLKLRKSMKKIPPKYVHFIEKYLKIKIDGKKEE